MKYCMGLWWQTIFVYKCTTKTIRCEGVIGVTEQLLQAQYLQYGSMCILVYCGGILCWHIAMHIIWWPCIVLAGMHCACSQTTSADQVTHHTTLFCSTPNIRTTINVKVAHQEYIAL